MTERQYLAALYSFSGFGPARTKLLITYFGSSKKAWMAKRTELLKINLSTKMVNSFLEHRENFDLKELFKKMRSLNIKLLTYKDEKYPKNLKDLGDAPLVLYVRGNLKYADENAIAMVGSRKMTTYGKEVTQKLAIGLANLGVTIVSGLAFGVDLAAHKATLDAGGRCIAVLASGIDMITPRSNEWLGLKIINEGGAVLSEYPPGVKAQKYFFPFRNRIISGLAKGVIVVEGMRRSGTIHTANHAADQGRQVFAVPGQITSPMSQAPHYLIENGAKMVTDVGDIVNELDMLLKVDKDSVEKIMPSDANEEKLLKILANEPLHVDEIIRASRLGVEEATSKLTVLEIKGMVRNVGGGIYKKNS